MAETQTITSYELSQPAPAVQRYCDDWNRKARFSGKTGEQGLRIAVVKITRPWGAVNHHLKMRLPNGRQETASLPSVETGAIRSQIKALLAKTGQQVHFEF